MIFLDSGQALQGLIVIGLLALSAFFSSAETAMMTVNKIRVRNLAEAGLSHAVVLEKILSNQPKMLSAILIGNNIVNISASSLMTVLVMELFNLDSLGSFLFFFLLHFRDFNGQDPVFDFCGNLILLHVFR